jgi:PAS domain S-box-containing protein
MAQPAGKPQGHTDSPRTRRTKPRVQPDSARHAEPWLREKEDWVLRASRAAGIGLFEWNISQGRTDWSLEACRLLGQVPDAPPSIDQCVEAIHPDDRERIRGLIAEVERKPGSGRFSIPQRQEFRVVHPDGEVLWLCTDTVTEQVRGEVVLRGSVRDITERKQVDAALLESEDKLRASFANAAIGFAITMPDGRFVDANPAYCALTGYRIDELRSLRFSYLVHPEDHATNMVEIRRMLEGASSDFVIENRYVRKGGQVIWVRKSVSVVRDAQGAPKWIIALIQDITERKRTGDALQKATERYALLSRTATALLASSDPQALVQELCTSVMRHLQCDVFFNYLADDTRETLHLNACAGVPDELKPDIIGFDGSVCGCVARDGRRMIVEDIQGETGPLIGLVRSFGIQAYCCHPLVAAGAVIGTLSFGTRERTAFTDDQIELMRAVADQVAIAIMRIRAEREILNSETRLRQQAELLEHAPVLVRDMEDRIIIWTSGMEKLYGFARAEALGRVSHELLNTTQPGSLREFRVVLKEKGRWEGELRHSRNDGSEVTVTSLQVLHTDVSGAPAAVIEVNNDITELKRVQAAQHELLEERGRLLESERTARGEAERANRLKDEFLANLSHELRTPLNSILGWAQILRRNGTDSEGMSKGLEVIERNTRLQTQLISDLLDVSRILTGKMRLEFENCDPAAALQSAVDALTPTAEAKRIRIEKIIDPRAGVVLGDLSRLQQTFWNLLSNAIKFTPNGGQVRVEVRRLNSTVEIAFRDNGVGIAPEFLPHVFERFRQADSSTTKSHSGLGLGLAIVKHLVELHGGSVLAESPGPGMGATFTVALPVTAAGKNKALAHDNSVEELGVARIVLDGVTVVCIDDEPDTGEVIRRLLEERGARVQLANSATAGIALVQELRPDVLIGDIGMPGEDGYAMIRKIRALPPDEGGLTPAIALTAYSRFEDRTRAMLAGYQYHLSKPVEFAELVTALGMITHRLPGRA